MKKNIALSIVLLLGLISTSCKKYEHCDNARVCVKNIGSDTIAYSWNDNSLSDTLLPGQLTCTDAGEYNANPNSKVASTAYFQTGYASWAIKPTSCNTEKEIK